MASVPKISTMITFRQHRFELVEAFFNTHRSDVAEALELIPGGDGDILPFGPPPSSLAGEADVSEAWARWVEPLVQRLKEALENLIEAEHQHLDEVGSHALPRRRRDRGVAELRQVLFDLRQVFRGLYGHDQARELGFENRIAKDPIPLLRQGERVHDQFLEMSGETRSVPPPRYAGLEINPEYAANHLEPRLRELREAMDQVHDDLGRAQRTKVSKDRAMKMFDGTYRAIVKMLISAFLLSGQPELAAKLPLSLRRDGRKTGG